jgi:hypothetical protein
MSEFHDPSPDQVPPAPSGAESGAYQLRFYVEDPAGDVYRAEALSSTRVSDVAADFFEERGWPTRDQAGRPQRAVVERVDPDNPERTARLRSDQTLHDAGVQDEDTLRVLPESVAGAISPHERLRALIHDQRELAALVETDSEHLAFRTNADVAPTRYEITFGYPSVRLGDHGPEISYEHRVEIVLPADYPLVAPVVRWLTPIFHPNISADGHVCLGVLQDRYLPGLGLAYIVRMLADVVRYRNYGLSGVFNMKAAEWANSPEGQAAIVHLGGSPIEQPVDVLIDLARREARLHAKQRTRFLPADRIDED